MSESSGVQLGDRPRWWWPQDIYFSLTWSSEPTLSQLTGQSQRDKEPSSLRLAALLPLIHGCQPTICTAVLTRHRGHIPASRKRGTGLVPFKGQTQKSQVSPLPPTSTGKNVVILGFKRGQKFIPHLSHHGASVTGEERKSGYRDNQ